MFELNVRPPKMTRGFKIKLFTIRISRTFKQGKELIVGKIDNYCYANSRHITNASQFFFLM